MNNIFSILSVKSQYVFVSSTAVIYRIFSSHIQYTIVYSSSTGNLIYPIIFVWVRRILNDILYLCGKVDTFCRLLH